MRSPHPLAEPPADTPRRRHAAAAALRMGRARPHGPATRRRRHADAALRMGRARPHGPATRRHRHAADAAALRMGRARPHDPATRRRRHAAAVLLLLACGLPAAAQPVQRWAVAAVDAPALRQWDDTVERQLRTGGLRRYETRPNLYRPGRRSERFSQYHEGVPVYGADLVRQTDAGLATAVFGTLFAGIDVDTAPGLAAPEARAAFEAMAGPGFGLADDPSLWVFPAGAGGYTLAWRGVLSSFRDVFIDAGTGEVVFEASRIRHQTIGVGIGQMGDRRKMSTVSAGGAYRARDGFRPAVIQTLDMAFDEQRFLNRLRDWAGGAPPPLPDLAADDDNLWEDGVVVDVHAGLGWSYDYLATQLGWRGLDGRDGPITAFVHPVTPSRVLDGLERCFQTAANPFVECAPFVILLGMIDNAAWVPPPPDGGASTGFIVFGEPFTFPLALTALDVVAHEAAHGVTHYTAGLGFLPPPNESGAIAEAFSDIIATATEFHVQEPGRGPLRADYLIGEDAGFVIRSLRDPREVHDPVVERPYPDHYDHLYRGNRDAGGVHFNATILGHAYFLAVEGGVNRTSGRRVAGVGAENRLQIERIFFNAWANLMPAFPTHAVAAQCLLQSAADLFGADAAPARALRDALAAVGIPLPLDPHGPDSGDR